MITRASLGVEFGAAVAISGTRVVVGAPADDTRGLDAGIAYVYDLTRSNPNTGVVTLYSPDAWPGDRFGSAVGVSGTRVIVGSPFGDAGAIDAGRAFLFDCAGSTPDAVVATFNNPEPDANDQFGTAVAIAGDRAVVGAPGDSTGAAAAGSAYGFDLLRTNIHKIAYVDVIMPNPSPAPGDRFGAAVGDHGWHIGGRRGR